MMRKVLYFVTVVFIVLSLGCEDEEEPLAISLLENSSEGIESDGSKSFTYVLNRAADQEISIEFENEGTALLNGDYTIESFVAIIGEGSTSVEIPFDLIDDPVIESENKVLELNVVDIQGMDNASSENLTYSFAILDNDEIPTDGLQVDLLWRLGQGEDIDLVNLDLFLATDVVIEDDLVTDYQLYSITSENASGFESLLLSDDAPNGEYYIVIFYNQGSTSVDFEVNLSSLAESDKIESTFESSDSGSGLFLGPIVKDGTLSSRTTGIWSVKTTNKFLLAKNN